MYVMRFLKLYTLNVNYIRWNMAVSIYEQQRLFAEDEKKMWRLAGFEQMLVSPAKRDQNEMRGLQKRDRFWCASCLWTKRDQNETTHDGKAPKPENWD